VLALVFLSHSYIVSANIMKKANAVRLQTGFLMFGLPVFVLLALVFQPVAAFIISWDIFLLIILSSVFFNVVGFPLWLISLKKLKPWILASALVVQSVAGAVFSFIWLGQTLSFVQIIGGIVILISVYFISLRGVKG
jgi:drug/metabolite transporter (DMT)-like permease